MCRFIAKFALVKNVQDSFWNPQTVGFARNVCPWPGAHGLSTHLCRETLANTPTFQLCFDWQ